LEGKIAKRGSAAGRRVKPEFGGTDLLGAYTPGVAAAALAWWSFGTVTSGRGVRATSSFGMGTSNGRSRANDGAGGLPPASEIAVCAEKRQGGLECGDAFPLPGGETLCRLKPMGGTGTK